MYKVKENKLVAAGVKYFTSNLHDVHDILLRVIESVNSDN
jgi:hypothetical protein